MAPDEYFEDLLAVLLDPDRELNPAQVAELSDLGADQADRFASAWHQASSPRRQQIAELLGVLSEENLELLFDRVNRVLLDDASPEVRRQAIQNLWEDERDSLGRRLIQLAESDPDDAVQFEAVRALGRFVYLGELDKLQPDTRDQVQEALLRILQEAASPRLQRLALESLGYSSRDELSDHIQRSYDSDDEERMRSALVAMGRSADNRWLPIAISHLDDRSPQTRAAAARAVGELEGRKATASLLELLDDANEQVRQAAIWSLGQIGGDAAREALLELQEQEADGRWAKDIDEALDHIAFLEGTPDLMLFDFDVDE